MAVESIALVPAEGVGDGMLQFHDAQSGCTFLVGTPQADPTLWADFMDGALAVYRHYGAEDALEYDAVIDGRSTTLFCVAVDSSGRAVAGVRAEGPHRQVDEVHAVQSWAGRVGEASFRRMVADQIPEGVIECKAGWAARDAENRAALADWVARSIVYCMALLGARYVVGVSPEHALPCYRSSGAKVAWWVPATSYPDARYSTVPVWWDMQTYRSVATEAQVRLIDSELSELLADGAVVPTSWTHGEGLAPA
ncbi:hypothetical protein [Nocardia huaxiensis]|uniref:GNAT family N-acetyltransferase n=1 Tax=Nocardia huaxiensis TaxID=2755382 RepID=A0A7D6VGW5_9NOCA|nr:hypothetical protein [Nocardia huaxiensis]QLY32537.1 hypothetical protein H0264_09985 [Nocardia huaxiensis]UFS93735.1 hypothetical protein LPY97_23385 [Nocardia huaxiensis]